MDLCYCFLPLVASFLSLMLFRFLFTRHNVNQRCAKLKLPPSPRAWPVIGHLHLLSKVNHRGLQDLAQKYGSIFLLRLGQVDTVVVSSAEMAKTILKTQDHVFSDRASNSATQTLLYGGSNISFSAYNAHWRLLRKIATTHMLGSKAVKSLVPFIEHQIYKVLVDPLVVKASTSDKPQVEVNLSEAVTKLLRTIFSGIVMGNEDWEEAVGLQQFVDERLYLIGAPDIGDFLPWLRWLDLQGLRRRQKLFVKKVGEIYDKVIADHAAKQGQNDIGMPDFVDAVLAYEGQISGNAMKALIIDMTQGGVDTVSMVVEWAMSQLLRHPHAMHRVQAELHSVVGPEHRVSHADMAKLPYLGAVVKETLRLRTPVPLLLPRRCSADCDVGGYLVPRGATVLVNVWAMARDKEAWGPRAEEFWPDRFVEPDDAVAAAAAAGEVFWPFGAGRRSCAGMRLGLVTVELVLAHLLHCFHWSLPLPLPLPPTAHHKDQDEISQNAQLVLLRASPLIAMVAPRFGLDLLHLLCFLLYRLKLRFTLYLVVFNLPSIPRPPPYTS